MTVYDITKHRAVVRTDAGSPGQFTLTSWLYHGNDSTPTIPAAPAAGFEAVEVSDETLAGLTYEQFMNQKKAIIVDGAFDSWGDKAAAPSLAVDVNPKADASNTPYLGIQGGVAGATLKVEFSRHVDHNLGPEEEILLNEAGTGDFQFRVSGLGPLTISVSCPDCIGAHLDVTVDPGSFP
jgi:hypothetical protein